MMKKKENSDSKPIEEVQEPMSRRTFLKGSAASVIGMSSLVAALEPLLELESGAITIDDMLQKHYSELKPEQMQDIIKNLKAKCVKDYGVMPAIRDLKPQEGVGFAYALNLTRCIGCRKCAHACMAENNQHREYDGDIEMSYIRVLELEKGSINVETSNHYYNPETVPQKDKFYMPVQCHQCRDAPCTKACPVSATWKEDDGIVAIDYDWCIGCRYCMAACPYDARRFNWKKPEIPKEEINTNQGVLSNRIRPSGVVEKCTFCMHRTRDGRYPACMEVCPTGARIFGNILDPDSEINYILNNKRVYILKEEIGTNPRFYYFFDT